MIRQILLVIAIGICTYNAVEEIQIRHEASLEYECREAWGKGTEGEEACLMDLKEQEEVANPFSQGGK